MGAALRVVAPGLATTVQDCGRPGFAHIGVPPSGAVDPDLAALANRLVGNPAGAAVIETCGGLELVASRPVLIASTVEAAARSVPAGGSISVPAGHGRLWHYLAVRGGIAGPAVLGSRSTDTLSGLGPAPIVVGTELAVGPEPRSPVEPGHAPLRPVSGVVRVSAGPRADWFTTDALEQMAAATWRVTASSRVGVRLSGARLARVVGRELPSEGLVRGAIQVPPDGDPVMLLADHPTTGGYPVIAVVDPDDVATVAQTPPGATLRFTLA